MPTNRVPIRRAPRLVPRFTDAALEAFREMQKLERQCCCPPRDWEGQYQPHLRCDPCNQWWDEHDILHRGITMQALALALRATHRHRH